MATQESNTTPEDHVWDVESSAPPVMEDELDTEGHNTVLNTTSNTPGYVALILLLLSFVLPAFLEPWSLLIPAALAVYGLAWAWTKRKTSSHAGIISAIIITILLMMGAGFLAMQMIPEEAWGDVFSMLFYAGWILLIPALSGIAFILVKRQGKRKPQ